MRIFLKEKNRNALIIAKTVFIETHRVRLVEFLSKIPFNFGKKYFGEIFESENSVWCEFCGR